MNDRENMQLVQQAYRAVQTGRMRAFLELLREDVWCPLPQPGHVPFVQIWRGCKEVGRFCSIVFQMQDIVQFEPGHYSPRRDRVVVLGRFSSQVKVDGKDSGPDWTHVWTMVNGKVSAFHEYVDAAALSTAAIGAATRSDVGRHYPAAVPNAV